MHRQGVRVATMVYALLLAFGSVLITAPTAHAASACVTAPSKGNCDGKDPQVEGCTDGVTIWSRPISNGRINVGLIEVRWSNMCKANWTRTTSWVGSTTLFAAIRRTDTGWYQRGYRNTTQMWSVMLYAPNIYAAGQSSVYYPWTNMLYTYTSPWL